LAEQSDDFLAQGKVMKFRFRPPTAVFVELNVLNNNGLRVKERLPIPDAESLDLTVINLLTEANQRLSRSR
jgi:hypothetical protein